MGTVMPWDAYDERGRLLLRKGLVIDRNSQIEALIERGLFVQTEAAAERPPREVAEPSAVSSVLEARRRLELLCTPGSPTQNFLSRWSAISSPSYPSRADRRSLGIANDRSTTRS